MCNEFFNGVTKQQKSARRTFASMRASLVSDRFAFAAPTHNEVFTRATGLRRREFRRTAQSLAANLLTVAVLKNPKAAPIPHNQIEVVSIGDLAINTGSD